MKITYDKEAEAMYIYLRPAKKIAETREVGPNTLVDVAHDGDVVGIEILGVKAQHFRSKNSKNSWASSQLPDSLILNE